jgi:hypothetical protein
MDYYFNNISANICIVVSYNNNNVGVLLFFALCILMKGKIMFKLIKNRQDSIYISLAYLIILLGVSYIGYHTFIWIF